MMLPVIIDEFGVMSLRSVEAAEDEAVVQNVAVQDVFVQKPVLCYLCTYLMKVDTVVDSATRFNAVALALCRKMAVKD